MEKYMKAQNKHASMYFTSTPHYIITGLFKWVMNHILQLFEMISFLKV